MTLQAPSSASPIAPACTPAETGARRSGVVLEPSIASAAGCGGCSLCCKVMGVVELKKPGGVWCEHAEPLAACGGCTVHASRPPTCRDFECVWLQSQHRRHGESAMPQELRPDRCGVIFDVLKDGAGLVAHVDPRKEGAHERRAPRGVIDRALASGMQVVIACAEKRALLIGRRAP